jgi:hypothetical protein
MGNTLLDENLVRIYFHLDPEDWHGRPNEGLWAEPLNQTSSVDIFRLRNSPFFAKCVSFEDIVRAVPRPDGGHGLEYAGVIDHSGHSTYMLLVPPNQQNNFEIYWKRLECLDCTFESTSIQISLGPRTLYSVDVPHLTDIHAVYSILDDGESNGIWVFQEGYVGHKFESSRNTQS